jgi:streptolysin S family bacteriocin protoxin
MLTGSTPNKSMPKNCLLSCCCCCCCCCFLLLLLLAAGEDGGNDSGSGKGKYKEHHKHHYGKDKECKKTCPAGPPVSTHNQLACGTAWTAPQSTCHL